MDHFLFKIHAIRLYIALEPIWIQIYWQKICIVHLILHIFIILHHLLLKELSSLRSKVELRPR